MKPITLKMTAFGPYKDTEVIDFSKLHEHGIFVVSGPTGAGKTTIFDAITFALYGSGSGEDRESSILLRSDFAEDTVDTAVELTFLVQGTIYKMLRSFNYAGTKKKQEIYKQQNGEWISAVEKQQVKLVLQKVEELLGLTREQFNQIVMLPQGEYQKMLTSESKDKEAIFRKLFKTQKYEKFVEILKGKRDLAVKAFERAESMQDQYIGEIKAKLPQRESNLFIVVDQPQVNLYQLQEALEQEKQYYEVELLAIKETLHAIIERHDKKFKQLNLQKDLNERIRKYKARLVQLENLIAQKEEMELKKSKVELAEKASKIDLIEKSVQKLQQDKHTIQELMKKLEMNRQSLELEEVKVLKSLHEAKSNESKRENLVAEITKYQELMQIYQKAENKRNIVLRLQANLDVHQKKVNQAEVQLQQSEEQLQLCEKYIDKKEKELLGYEQVLEQKQAAEIAVELVEKYLKLEEQNLEAIERTKNAKEKSVLLDEKFKNLQKQAIQHQASLLITQLVDGEPCPVCGSTEHVKVNRAIVEEVDEDMLVFEQQQADKEMRSFYKEQSTLESLKVQKSDLQTKLDSLQFHPNKLLEYEAELQRLNNELNNMRSIRGDIQKLKLQKEEVLQYVNSIQTSLNESKLKFEENQRVLLLEKGQLEQLESSLPDKQLTLIDLELKIKVLSNEVEMIKAALELAEDAHKKVTLQLSEVNTKLQVSSSKLDEIVREHAEEQLHFNNTMTLEGFSSIETYKKSKMDEETRKHLLEQYTTYNQMLFATEQIIKEEKELANKEEIDITILELELQAIKEELTTARQKETNINQWVKQCATTVQNLTQNAEQIEQLKEKLNKAIHLHDIIRGQNEHKISFERFVQMGYLEQITIAANERLRYLSNKQYYLVTSNRKEGNAQSGLSLDVHDVFTGQTRDVKSLSGGEKFNASLSLALGMADVIQSVQGSVHIETMFIDEGFGTLDEESLQKAIDTLMDLQQSGRIIGIISHVAELKAAIPAILEVQKLKEGISKTNITIK